MKYFCTIAFTIVFFFGYAQKPSSHLATYTVAGTQVKYTTSWTLDTSGAMGSKWIIFSPLENDSDKFRENVNLIIQDMQGHDVSLDQYVEISVSQIKQLFTDGKIYESDRLSNSNGDYQKLIFSATQGTFTLQFEQYYYIRNGKAYTLTLTTELSKFSTYQPIGEQILNSFIFTQ